MPRKMLNLLQFLILEQNTKMHAKMYFDNVFLIVVTIKVDNNGIY